MITIVKWILLPISLIYQAVVWIRNQCYDRGILKSKSFQIPTIVIGNLTVGGTGKSPMTEYLVRLLSQQYKLATLSRGYGRTSKGFRLVQVDSSPLDSGDEPLQFKRKFPNLTVAVCEDRCTAVQILQQSHEVILLDDAYQHRKLKPGYTILLFDYHSLFQPTLTLPTGPYRDNISASKRANLIVITKCPQVLTTENKAYISHKIRKYSNSPIFYTGIQYDAIRDIKGRHIELQIADMHILLLTGIANPRPLVEFLRDRTNDMTQLHFADHHNYSLADYQKIRSTFDKIDSTNKILVTTEKDMQRLDRSLLHNIPLYYIPIRLKTADHQQDTFDHFILQYLLSHPSVN